MQLIKLSLFKPRMLQKRLLYKFFFFVNLKEAHVCIDD
jgi:hypothetical protein